MTKRIGVLSFVLIWLSAGLVVLGLDPHTAMEKYIHLSWTTRDGLPQNTIHAIVQDKQGFLWLGTDGGLVRFDGSVFKTFNQENTPTLINNAIRALAVASDGALWLGTYGGGITVLKKGLMQKYPGQGIGAFINVLQTEKDNVLWCGTMDAGIMQYRNQPPLILNFKKGLNSNNVLSLCRDNYSRIWIGTDNGLNCWENGKLSEYPFINAFIGEKITALLEDSYGYLWVGTGKGSFRFSLRRLRAVENKNTLENYRVGPEPAGKEIRALLEDRHHNIWLATNKGLSRMTLNQENNHFTTHVTLGEISLLSLFEDEQGNLWIGSETGGLHVLREGKFTFFTEKDGLATDYIKTIFQDSQGILWIGTRGGGLNEKKIHGKPEEIKGFKTYTKENGLSSNDVESLTEDKQGNLWVGTTAGLNRFRNGVFEVFTTAQGLSNNTITCLHTPAEDKLWIGTFGGGLNLFQGGKFQVFSRSQGLPDNFVLALTSDLYGNLWIGTNHGVSCFDGQLFRHFSGMPGVPEGMVLDVYCDAEGTIWIATHAEGFIRFRDGVFTRFELGQPFVGSAIFRILEDNHENLWLSSATGILSLSRRRLNAYVRKYPMSIVRGASDGYMAFVRGLYFQEEDGLQTAVCSGGSQPAGWKASDGTLFFPTIQGMAVMNLSKCVFSVAMPDQENEDVPDNKPAAISYITILREAPVFIEKISVDGQPLKQQGDFKLAAGTQTLEFQFVAINYRTPGKTLYKFRLTGYENNWQVSRENRVVYHHLPAGDYEFKVYARNSDGNWSYEGDSRFFSIADSFFRSLWFYLVLAVALVGAIVVVQQMRKKDLPLENIPEEKYKGSTLTQQRSKQLLNELLKVMAAEKPFLDPELSLQKLGQRLGITKEDLSQVINEQLGMNFKNFLNKHRIEEAKKRLLDPQENQFVLLKIAFDVGFNSKSAFNASFKKVTGLSPSEYRKKYQA